MTDKTCKICGCKDKNKMFELCSNLKLMGEHFPESPSFVTECPECGFVYVDMEASQDDFNRYYSSPNSNPFGYYEIYGEEHTNAYFNDILNKFKDKINADSVILDHAGGSGDFTKFLLAKGYKNAEQLEISEKCAEIAKTKGVNTIIADGCKEPADELLGKYDLITMIHSLEHFTDIDKVIENAKKMLKKDGFLYIEVPDAERYSKTDSVPYTMYTLEHIYHFNKDTMKNLGNAFGLKTIDIGQFFKAESYDVLYGLYQYDNNKTSVRYSDTLKTSVLEYREHSANRLRPFIQEFEKTQEKLILWGIGASTALLMNGTFDKCNVLQLIDRNKQRQGLNYKIGVKNFIVQDPDAITDKDATIVVLPYWYHDSIMKQIKGMGFSNPVKSLMGEK